MRPNRGIIRGVDRLSSQPLESALPRGTTVLLLEDDAVLSRRLVSFLEARGGEVTIARNLAEARRLVREECYDYALVDMHLPDGLGLALLRDGVFSENTGVVAMTAYGGIAQAVDAVRLGAGDYLTKPFELEAVPLAFLRCRTLRRATRRDEQRSGGGDGEPELFFGESLAEMRSQLEQMLEAERRLLTRLPPLLIEGETGTGKSLLARWVHRRGPRANRPFVSLNCAALPELLAESELFGHERGAFTDAKQARVGLFEAADGGTLFLDEVGALSAQTQAKLLTAVEEGSIRRLGGTKTTPVDVRLVAANNCPLGELVAQGLFREDLFHRLNLLRLLLPPLRERGADLVVLARQLLAGLANRYRLGTLTISAEGEARLRAQAWRGNIRELAHVIERAVIFNKRKTIDFEGLGDGTSRSVADWLNPAWKLPETGFSIDGVITDLINTALRETEGNISAAARRLGVTRDYLRYHQGGGRMEGEGKGTPSRPESCG
ncbi:MAG: sigma-54-dependent Fis family transcriptional regulator [Opitutaceae bacterium]|nr:sigma-54-dependent Fis family transcriptional regulator [Opitutaceae bacterium]